MLRLSSLKNTYMDRPVAILGGGPALPGDLETVLRRSDNPLLIAINYHAHLLGIRTEYMVYNDDPENDPSGQMPGAIRAFQGVKVSLDPNTSDVLMDAPYWEGMYSSNLAAWFACWLGCSPIYLCGMDCYQGEQVYCHPHQHDVPSFHYPLDDHLRIWVEEGVHKLRMDTIQAVSGPLQRVFGGLR